MSGLTIENRTTGSVLLSAALLFEKVNIVVSILAMSFRIMDLVPQTHTMSYSAKSSGTIETRHPRPLLAPYHCLTLLV